MGQPRADQGSHGQGFLALTFHVEGLELDQVPNGTREIRQLIPFHIQDLKKGKWRENAHTQTTVSTLLQTRHHLGTTHTSLSPDSPVKKIKIVMITFERWEN